MGSNVRCNEVASKQTRCHVATRGQQHRAGAGGSTGRERIAVRDPSGFRGRSYLCSIYRNVRLIRG